MKIGKPINPDTALQVLLKARVKKHVKKSIVLSALQNKTTIGRIIEKLWEKNHAHVD